MVKIGLLSDTHGYWDDRYAQYFVDCDEIWHAGDIGSINLADRLAENKILRAVHGNIDGHLERLKYPKDLFFECEQHRILLTHIGGYPGKYAYEIQPALMEYKPTIFVCGHSHIVKVKYDQKLGLLHLNPGAAGNFGFHAIRTLMRFEIEGKDIRNLEVIELGTR